MDEQLEAELRKVRITIHAIVASFQEPSTPLKIQREYSEEYGVLSFEKFGYQCLEKLLDDHPRLFASTDLQGRRAYKAKLSDNSATQDIQYQISRQKKKKKNGRGRGGYYRAMRGHNRQASFTNFQGNLQSRLTFEQHQNWRGRGITPQERRVPLNQGRIFTPPKVLPGWEHRPLRPSQVPQGYFNCPPSLMKLKLGSTTVIDGSVTEGSKKIMDVINALGGAARLNRFAQRYRERYGCDFDENELQKYFGTGKLSSVRKAMQEQIVFVPLSADEMLIKSKAFIEQERLNQQGEGEAKSAAVAQPQPRIPILPELMEHFTLQLKQMFPNPIPLSEVGTFYARHNGIEINPERLYAKHWSELFATTFSSRTMVKDGCIYLHPTYVAKHNIKPQRATESYVKVNNGKLAAINDLHTSESGDESDDDLDESSINDVTEAKMPITTESKSETILETPKSGSASALFNFKPFGRLSDKTKVEDKQKEKVNAQDQGSVVSERKRLLNRIEIAKPQALIVKVQTPAKVEAVPSPSKGSKVEAIAKAPAKIFNPRYFNRTVALEPVKSAASTSIESRIETKGKEVKKTEKNKAKEPTKPGTGESREIVNGLANISLTEKPKEQAKPIQKDGEGSYYKFNPVTEMKKRHAEKVALLKEKKLETGGTLRTLGMASVTSLLLPQRSYIRGSRINF